MTAELTNLVTTDVSPDVAVLIRAAREGGATRSGDVVVPPHLAGWARGVLSRATPWEMALLDEAIAANFEED
jgi:hypothetical protein